MKICPASTETMAECFAHNFNEINGALGGWAFLISLIAIGRIIYKLCDRHGAFD